MTIAHLRSRLAIKSCLPVDFKNTLFLAHYDITEEENLKGIRPVGNRYSLDFNGTDTYIKTSLNNPITQNSFTIECFIYTDVTNQSKVIAGQFDSFGLSLTSGKIKAVIWDNDWNTTYTLPTGRWVHVAFTFDGTIYSLYFDGILQGTYSHPASVPVTNIHPFTIGAWSYPLFENYFKGRISEVRLWNYARTSSEINSCMNKHLTGTEPGLVGYWKLNEGTGSIVLDYSSNGKHGKINGGVSWNDGQTVFTLRPSEGKYGGCIAVEEGTENLLATVGGGAAQDWTKWSHWNSSAYWGLTEQYDDPIWGKVFKGTKNGATHTDTYIFDYYPYSYSIGDVYTFSCWMRVNKTMTNPITFYLVSNVGSQHRIASNSKTINFVEGQWQYVTFTSSSVTEDVPSGYGGFGLSMGSGWNDCIVEIAYPQFEKKSFSTSFVNGIRDKGILQYPLIIDPNNFTLNFWAKCTGNDPFHIDILVTTDENNRVFFRPTNTTTINGGRVVNGTTSFIGELNLINDITQWNMYTLVSEGSTMRIYQNGVKLGENQSILQLNSPSNYLAFNRDNKPRNALFDEVRIDRVPRTDTEIMEWYISQAPFYPKGIHKKLL